MGVLDPPIVASFPLVPSPSPSPFSGRKSNILRGLHAILPSAISFPPPPPRFSKTEGISFPNGRSATSNTAHGPISTASYFLAGPPYCIQLSTLPPTDDSVSVRSPALLAVRAEVLDGRRRYRVTPPYSSFPYTTEAGGSARGDDSSAPEGKSMSRHPNLFSRSDRIDPRDPPAAVDFSIMRKSALSSSVAFAALRSSPDRSTTRGVGVDFIHLIHDDASSRSDPPLRSAGLRWILSRAFFNAKAPASSIQLVAEDGD
mmetsp:Transcript_8338/g.25147  ORF Transcript_8338/g.25147 Transcript_8338/m.25147 type:complete len:258 (+) Transcript_8338:1798-2571(+)